MTSLENWLKSGFSIEGKKTMCIDCHGLLFGVNCGGILPYDDILVDSGWFSAQNRKEKNRNPKLNRDK